MDDLQLRELLIKFGLSWNGYQKVRKGVKKRINRHIQELGLKSFRPYISMLDADSHVRSECEHLLCVSISRFFRDHEFWNVLKEKLLPLLIKEHKDKLKVWCAGCASGEEVYSIRIIWEQLRKDLLDLPKLELVATDINPTYLERAKAGVYSSGSVKEIPKELLPVYFETTIKGKLYKIKDILKKDISWIEHNMLSAPAANSFHIIFLRNNLLTYCGEEPKIEALTSIIKSLSSHGFLIIGKKEALPFETSNLIPLPCYHSIFKKK
jgi:chemotaxis methyl-accepting protein methylase